MARPQVNVQITGEAQGLSRAVTTAQGSLRRLSSDLAGIQRLAGRALNFAGVGSGVSVGALVALAKSAADTADEFGKMSQRTGVAVEDLSRLAYGASLNGASLADLETSLRNLSRTMDEASRGSGAAADRYQSLGIEVRDAAGNLRAPLDVLRDLADRFAGMEDGAQKSAIATQVLGRSGAALIPLLNQGSDGLARLADESDRFGKTISTDLARRAEEFNDNLTRLQALAGGVGQEIGLSLVPALNALAVSFLQAATEQRQLTGDNSLQNWAEGGVKTIGFLVDVLEGFWRVVRIIGTGIAGYAAMGAEALRGNLAGARLIYSELSKDVENILLEQQFSDRLARNLAPDVQQTATNVEARRRLEQQLNTELLALGDLRARQAKQANEEELKGVERLKTELQSAWQQSIEGARRARQEAADLLQQAADAAQSGLDKAEARRLSGLSDDEREAAALQRARQLRTEARSLADRAILAAYDGNLRAAEALAAQAAKAAESAEGYVDNIRDDETAARLFEDLGRIRAETIRAQARAKEQEAVSLTEIAAQQEAQIQQAENRLKVLKAELAEPVTIEAEIEGAASKIEQLKAQLDALPSNKTITINTVTAGLPGDGFASGGYTGPGGKYQPAGIVHRGEFVMPQHVVNQPGMLALLTRMLRGGRGALPGYSSGGLVSGLDARRAAMPALGGGSGGAPVLIDLGALGRFEMSAKSEVRDELVRAFNIVSLQRGRRR